MQRHSPLIFAIAIFAASLFPTILFGASALTPQPADVGDDEKEDDGVLTKFWESAGAYSLGFREVMRCTKNKIFYRDEAGKILVYSRESKKVHPADPLETPNFVEYDYAPATQTHLSMIDSREKSIFELTGLDGSRNILSSNRNAASGPVCLCLSPDRKLLAYRFYEKDPRKAEDAGRTSIVSILDTSTGEEVDRFPDPIAYLTFLSNSLLHTGHLIYDADKRSLREDLDSCQNKINLGDNRYVAVVPHRKARNHAVEIVFKETVNGSFKRDKTLQKIFAPGAPNIIFTAPNRMFLHNYRCIRFFEDKPQGSKLDFTCVGQIELPKEDDGLSSLNALPPESALFLHQHGVCEVTSADLTPLTPEQDPFDFNEA